MSTWLDSEEQALAAYALVELAEAKRLEALRLANAGSDMKPLRHYLRGLADRAEKLGRELMQGR